MVPVSRSQRRGAYIDLMRNYINGQEDMDIIPGRRNTVTSNLTAFDGLALGFFNHVKIRKRIVIKEEEGSKITTFVLNSDITTGDRNELSVTYWTDELSNIVSSINVGNDNNIDVILDETDDIMVGSGNYIKGKLNLASNGTAIGNNNILIDFEPELIRRSAMHGFPELSELMFETEITSIGTEGATSIEVDSTDKIMLGGKIFFGTMGAAFTDREVTWVSGSLVGFDAPLSFKEITTVGSRVFNHYPETITFFESSLSEDVGSGSKRIMLSDTGDMHLRDIVIDGSFHTKSFFQRTADNMVIIKDATDDEYPTGTTVVSEGIYPYLSWTPACSLETGSTYAVNSAKHSAYIGRTTHVFGIDYIVTGFNEDSITLDAPLPEGVSILVFLSVDEAPGGGPSNTSLSENVPGNSQVVEVDDASSFFVGQLIRLEGIVKRFTVISISENTIVLDSKIFGDSVDGAFYIGRVELPIDTVATKAAIEAGALDLDTYIFGES